MYELTPRITQGPAEQIVRNLMRTCDELDIPAPVAFTVLLEDGTVLEVRRCDDAG
jgi:uncharacterized protein GlcG (DUF336 family)